LDGDGDRGLRELHGHSQPPGGSYRLRSSIPEISAVRYARETDRKLVLHHKAITEKWMMKAQRRETLKQLQIAVGFDCFTRIMTRKAGR